MQTKELMIGDWVMLTDLINNGEKMQVKEIHGDGYITVDGAITKMFEPIPLTREILEKLGFQQISTNKYVSGKVTIAVFVEEFLVTIKSGNARVMMITIKYVHELQHALQLCGIEKNIEL